MNNFHFYRDNLLITIWDVHQLSSIVLSIKIPDLYTIYLAVHKCGVRRVKRDFLDGLWTESKGLTISNFIFKMLTIRSSLQSKLFFLNQTIFKNLK